MESVGTRVRHYRRLRRLTQDALAEQSGVERRYLGKIETGDVLEPGAETVKKLAAALSVTVRELGEPLGWWDDEPTPDWERAVREAAGDSEVADAVILAVRPAVEQARKQAKKP